MAQRPAQSGQGVSGGRGEIQRGGVAELDGAAVHASNGQVGGSDSDAKAGAMDGDLANIKAGDLADGFAEVAAVIGIVAAREMIRCRAGQDIKVPMKPTASLVDEIGNGPAAALCAELGGLRFTVPAVGTIARIIRRREIIDLKASGWQVKQIARQVRLTERAVWYVLKSDEAPDE